jgi:hypothetical protein
MKQYLPNPAAVKVSYILPTSTFFVAFVLPANEKYDGVADES